MRLSEDIPVLHIEDKSKLFCAVDGDFSQIMVLSQGLDRIKENKYVANDERLCALKSVKDIGREVFAELPLQAGWCYGGGKKANGIEWHKSSEVVVACTHCMLILGDFADIEDGWFDSAKSVALELFEGQAVELQALTLHLAPLATEDFFAVAILLPRGTNSPLDGGIDGELRAVNKWLLVHPENSKGIAQGGKVGVRGANIGIEA